MYSPVGTSAFSNQAANVKTVVKEILLSLGTGAWNAVSERERRQRRQLIGHLPERADLPLHGKSDRLLVPRLRDCVV